MELAPIAEAQPSLAPFWVQGSCKPRAMELAPIAEAQPSLAPFWVQSYEEYLK
jgi:hypothetical protein